MNTPLPPPLTPGQARIREKLAHLSPADKQKALGIIKQIAQHQERERMARAPTEQVINQVQKDAPLTPAEQAQAKKIQDKLAHLSPEERNQALEILKQIAQKQAQDRAAGTVLSSKKPSDTTSD